MTTKTAIRVTILGLSGFWQILNLYNVAWITNLLSYFFLLRKNFYQTPDLAIMSPAHLFIRCSCVSASPSFHRLINQWTTS